MKKNNNDLLTIYLNEFNFNFLYKGANKYKCTTTLKYLKLSKVSTYTKDKYQNYNLDPWVQSVSINTGKESKKHKIFKLGQPVKNIRQIWDFLSSANITSSVWGAMNSKFIKNSNLKYYFPDPWNYNDKSKPSNLMNLYLLPNYYAKNYLNISLIKIFGFSILFIIGLINNSKLVDLLRDIFFSLKIFFKKGFKNYVLFFLFDIFFLNIIYYRISKKKTDFTIIFLNSIAHYQHNNWNETQNEKVFFDCVERIFCKIDKINKKYESVILFNGFTQKKIPPEYLLRPMNPEKFLSNFIKFKSLEQDMTNGGFIFFDKYSEKKNSFEVLNQLYFNKKKVFQLKDFSKKIIFYKINLKSNKIIILKKNEDSIKEIRKFSQKYSRTVNIKNFFIQNVKFIKTTGVHISRGVVLHKSIKSLNNSKKL